MALTTVPLSGAGLPLLDQSMPPWPGTMETRGGVRLHVRRTPGADDVAVYVHGLGGSSTNWTDLAAQLRGAASGVAVDLPGFGMSEPSDGFDFSLPAHSDALGRFIDGLDAGAVHLLGNSMGGAVAMLLAAARPELVRTLTLISPAMPDRRPDIRRISDPLLAMAFVPVFGRQARRALAAMSPGERAAQVIKLCYADPSLFPDHRIAELADEHRARAGFEWANRALMRSTVAILRTWFSLGTGSLWTIARTVSAPTLVVWGAQDRVISARRAARTARLMPRARLLVLPRTGHVAQMERPVSVARAVLGMWEWVENDAW